ncbi:MAG: hypothetical protein ABIT01_03070 [Thermoanaerobaculia bacterium]
MLDRIDLHVEVPALPPTDFRSDEDAESSLAVRTRVVSARALQMARTGDPRLTNAVLSGRQLRTYAPLEPEGRTLLERAVEKLDLSARGFQRVVRVARTIADLDGTARIGTPHLAEALRFRPRADA